MSYRDWHVGMKVVCVDARGCGPRLVVGGIYTVRAMDAEWVYFEEPSTFGIYGPNMAGYRYRRFRPVQERKSDISIFTAMLDKPKVPA